MENGRNIKDNANFATENTGTGTIIANPIIDTICQEELGGESAEALPTEVKEKKPLKTRIVGFSLMVLTSVSATTQGSIVKYVNDLPTGMILLPVAIYMFCFFCAIVTYMGVSITDFPMKKWVAVRVATGSVAYVCKVWSFQFLPLGDASALVFTSPLFTCLIARIFLKERITPVTIFALFTGLTGVILIAKPSFIFNTESQEFPWYYTLVPLLSAFTLAIVYVIQRKIAGKVNPLTISFYIAAAQLFTGVGWQVASGDEYTLPLCYTPRILLVICSICLPIVWVAMNLALKYESAASASLVRNLDTALAFFIQIVLFGDSAETLSLIGAALIMSGTIIIALSKIFNITCGFKL